MALAYVAYGAGGLSAAAFTWIAFSPDFQKVVLENNILARGVIVTALIAVTTVGLQFGALSAMALTGFIVCCGVASDQKELSKKILLIVLGTFLGAAAGVVTSFILKSAWGIWKSLGANTTINYGIIDDKVVPILVPK